MDSTQPLPQDEQIATQREIIETLAQDTATPVDEVVLVYEAELASLKEWASVSDFVELFATRRTRNRLLLRQQH
jgi:hypothetical protein